MENVGLRAVIRYLGLKNLSPKEIHEDMTATLGEDAPSYSMVKKWAAEFKRGRQSLEDDPRPVSLNVLNLKMMFLELRIMLCSCLNLAILFLP